MRFLGTMSTAAKCIRDNLSLVNSRISHAANSCKSGSVFGKLPRLVCVSKTKPQEDIIDAYGVGQRHFGENYVNELEEKSQGLSSTCPDIRWHFIGHLQSNKVSKLLACPNLYMIETIDSQKLADKVNKTWSANKPPMNILIQVNTSNEEQKAGISPPEVCSLVQHVKEKCPNLKFAGLMTIGSFSHDVTTGPNPDFITLMNCKEEVMAKFSLDYDSVEVSMGMSNDFEHAIEMGSTNVRIGSTVFGSRDYKEKV